MAFAEEARDGLDIEHFPDPSPTDRKKPVRGSPVGSVRERLKNIRWNRGSKAVLRETQAFKANPGDPSRKHFGRECLPVRRCEFARQQIEILGPAQAIPAEDPLARDKNTTNVMAFPVDARANEAVDGAHRPRFRAKPRQWLRCGKTFIDLQNI